MKEALLHLGKDFAVKGFSFGYEGRADGEVVFNTAMVGYPESLTDPSYSGQILCVTYPLVGNYGVPEEKTADGISVNFESERIHVRGLIISDYSFKYSHWSAVKSLDEWLKEYRIPGIFGVDTREITKILREQGSMPGCIVPEGFEVPETLYDPGSENQVAIVSCKEVIRYGNPSGKKVVLLDCGVKNNILRCLLRSGDIEVIRVPWDYDFNTTAYPGTTISTPWSTTVCSSPTVPATRSTAARPSATFRKPWRLRSRYSVSAWATSCWPRPEGLRPSSSNTVTAATISPSAS